MTLPIILPTRTADPAVVELLGKLSAGDAIKITQTVRVGARTWPVDVAGKFRGVSYLSTGVTTDRIPDDDIVVPTVHFVKANGELASIALDENTKIVRG